MSKIIRTGIPIWLFTTWMLFLPQMAVATPLTPVDGLFPLAMKIPVLKFKFRRDIREISLVEIETLPRFKISIQAPWGMQGTFSGVRFVDLLKHLGLANSVRILLRAADEYKITLQPRLENGFNNVLFVTRFNGHPMSLKDKGPFRLIWANDIATANAGKTSTVKWIWSIVEIQRIR